MTKVFTDTDVLLDVFLETEPHHSAALRLLTDLRRRGTSCLTSAVVLTNMNYILAGARGREYAVSKLRSLRRMVGVAPMDEAMVDAAWRLCFKWENGNVVPRLCLNKTIPNLENIIYYLSGTFR